MPPAFSRSRQTWLFYLVYAVYGYVLNGLGPVTPFLKSELNLSYTAASLHFSAFAIGMILAGLGGHLAVARMGRRRVLWFALFGMSLSQLLVALGGTAWITVGASFLMGTIGSLLSSVIPSGLADEHGENRSIALSELNMIAAVGSAAAALAVGWLSYTFLGWRFALALPLLVGLALWFGLGRTPLLESAPASQAQPAETGGLPQRYWFFWLAIILVVSIEYCMVFWGANYLEAVANLPKASAVQAVSLFQAGMILGRMAASTLLRRFSTLQILSASLILAAAGFVLFWSVPVVWLAVIGLFITGLGIASLYPMVMALALGASGGRTVQASTRAGLASGIAVFVLPLILGRLADGLGIRLAYSMVVLLLLAAFVLIQFTARARPQPAAA